MAKTNKTNGKDQLSVEKIETTYKTYLLDHGAAPASVHAFCKLLNVPETDFYEFFGTLESVEKSIWKNYIKQVRTRLTTDSNYAAFSAREKVLSFYFSLAEVLRADRSFVLLQLKSWKNPAMAPAFLKGFRASFEEWAAGVLNEGKISGEIAKRPYIDERYQHLLWPHLLFILQFWSKDDSPNFDTTDAAIEKSVNLAFDLIGKGVLDNALDFGKFLYQNARS